MKRSLIISLGIGAVLTMTLPVLAQNQCADRELVLTQLADRFGESRQSIGMAQGDRVVETFASDISGSWTITVTLPDGQMCIIAAGQSWEEVEEAVASGQPT
ncbi:hypothetical protein [Maritimibacter sp. DP1N21-5]|uniref:hypothetical protein n=1 Tax=Maritimibacter sp. DP1N21-5 TaxID=2836867 RepID=UPI001C47C5B8|nr:hypothetical protein [Maritimibacter sp. DP1N21-5]MBV7410823.1 hypothetical protein [Maritimibacter sp. DP1N21-5]